MTVAAASDVNSCTYRDQTRVMAICGFADSIVYDNIVSRDALSELRYASDGGALRWAPVSRRHVLG